jgi:hypothetical protein
MEIFKEQEAHASHRREKRKNLTEGRKGNKEVGGHLLLYLNSGFQQD